MSRSAVVFAAIILQIAGGISTKDNTAGEVKPCEDFLSYACKLRNPTQRLYKHINSTGEISQVKEFDEHFFFEAKKLSEAEEKFYKFRKYCSQPTLEDKKRFLQKFNPTAGGWPALNKNWKLDKFDLQATLVELQSSLFPALFKITLTNEPYSFLNLIQVSLMISDYLHDEEHKQLMMQKLSNITDNVDEVISDSLIVEGLYTAEKTSSYHNHLVTYKDLQQEIPEIDWDRLFEATYGRTPPDSYLVQLQKMEHMKLLITKIFQVEPKVMANYLLYRLVHLLTDFDEAEVAALFRNVFYQMKMKEHYSHQTTEDLRDMLVSILRTLASTVNLFGDEDKLKNEKEINEFVFYKILPDIDDSYYDNLYKKVTVAEDDCYFSAVQLVTIVSKLEGNIHFQRNVDPFYVMRGDLMQTMAYDLPVFLNKSSAIKFEALTWKFLSNYFMIHWNPESSRLIRQCLENKFNEKFSKYEMGDVLKAQVFVKSYFDWAKDKEDLMQLEERKYNKSSKEVLLERLIARSCEPNFIEEKHKMSVTFANLKEMSDTYNCAVGSRFNPPSKCEIV